MANDLNLMQCIGRLGNDPEVRQLNGGSSVANISVAVGAKWKDKNSGELKERTEWIRCTAFGSLAGVIEKYLRKGSKVYLSGEWRTSKWQDSNGNDRYSTELNIQNMQMLDSKPEGGQQQSQQQNRPAQSQQGVQGPDDYDSDIPFSPFVQVN